QRGELHRGRRCRRAADQRGARRSHRGPGSGGAVRGRVRSRAAARACGSDRSAVSKSRIRTGDLPSRGSRVSPVNPRRAGAPSSLSGPMLVLAAVAAVVVIVGALAAFGLVDLSRLRSSEPSTAGLIAVPTPAKAIPAYTRVRRD